MKADKIDLGEDIFRYWNPDERDRTIAGGKYILQAVSSFRDI